jgi:hypothetical protein
MGVSFRRALYAGVVFWSALLLLLVQPILAKAILPWFGGSAGVWTTSVLFFQALLLGGYLYAHLLHRRVAVKQQVVIHLTMLAIAVAILPLNPSPAWKLSGKEDPVPRILGLLATSVGFPYLMLSATSPLLQSWYSRVFEAELPYRLFAVSNLGSLIALLSYPVLIEPWLTVPGQLQWWSAGFVIFAVACAAAGVLSWRRGADVPNAARPEWQLVLTWFGLAATPSVLWLAVGNHLSQDVAAVPFLWILPLALYLASFVLCFDRDGWYRPRIFRWLMPVAWGAIVLVVSQQGYLHIRIAVPALLAGLFLCCMFCHGELARFKPEPRLLTWYYLTISAGGAFGGLFVGLIAPNIFKEYMELPVALVASVVFAIWLLYNVGSRRALRVGAVAAAAMVVSIYVNDDMGTDGIRVRNFYGTLRTDVQGEDELRSRALYNGPIQHGLQFLEEGRTRIPTTYYGPASGAAIALRVLSRRGPVQVGVIGLGAGTMAAYARDRDLYRFYEINPAVIRVALDKFTFLKESPAPVEVVTGDARISLERESPHNFDLIVVDAFSGDSIPIHLLTREAMGLYFRHLQPDGAIAVHVTNKHLELSPVVEMLAREHGAFASLIHNSKESSRGIYVSSWVVVTKNAWLQKEIAWLSSPIPHNGRLRLWTDDYSNLLTILR